MKIRTILARDITVQRTEHQKTGRRCYAAVISAQQPVGGLFLTNLLKLFYGIGAKGGFNMRHDDTTVALEAAHIKWKQHGGPCEIPNGLALCAIHHKAFDKGSIGLDENMRVLVSDAVNGGGIVEKLFWDFDGKTIALPQVRKNYPFEGFVEWHRKEVFRG